MKKIRKKSNTCEQIYVTSTTAPPRPHVVIGEDDQYTDNDLNSYIATEATQAEEGAHTRIAIHRKRQLVRAQQREQPLPSQSEISQLSIEDKLFCASTQLPLQGEIVRMVDSAQPLTKESMFYRPDFHKEAWYYQCPCLRSPCEVTKNQMLDCCCQTLFCPCFLCGQVLFGKAGLAVSTPCLGTCFDCLSCRCAVGGRKIKNTFFNCLHESVCCCEMSSCLGAVFPGV